MHEYGAQVTKWALCMLQWYAPCRLLVASLLDSVGLRISIIPIVFVTCSSAVCACNIYHPTIYNCHYTKVRLSINAPSLLGTCMASHANMQLVMGKPVNMLSNYNQKQNRTEPEVHVIDEHYGGRCWILATQSTEKLVLCSVPTTKMGHVKLTWQQLSI